MNDKPATQSSPADVIHRKYKVQATCCHNGCRFPVAIVALLFQASHQIHNW